MTHVTKAVTVIAADPSGARLASGSVNYDVCSWDVLLSRYGLFNEFSNFTAFPESIDESISSQFHTSQNHPGPRSLPARNPILASYRQ